MNELIDAQPIYERLENEPGNWYARFLIYRNLPPNKRELLEAVRIHESQVHKGPYQPSKSVPGAWKRNAEKWDWKFRAGKYDAYLQTEAEARAKALREAEAEAKERILTEGYALKHKRVQALGRMAYLIEESMIDPETKEVNPKWVSSDKVREFRGCLDDVARELGDRQKQKIEVGGKDGGPIQYITEWGAGSSADDA